MRSAQLRALVVMIAGAATAFVPGWATAHEHRGVGPLEFVVGWHQEPAYAGFPNAVSVRLTQDGRPVTDAGGQLKVEVILGDAKAGPLAFEPAFGSPGEYRAHLMPTRPGAYAFHVTGSVKGQSIDQTFTASEKTFDPIRAPTEIQFPVKDPSAGDLATRVGRLGPRLEAAQARAGQANDRANIATMLAIVGIVATIVLGGIALARSGKAR